MTDINVHEDLARAQKVEKLAAVLIQYQADPETVEAFTDFNWAIVSQLAGTKPAGERTKAAVIEFLRKCSGDYKV